MYKIVGADQKEYGPITEEQLRQWIIEGRANAQTIVRFNEGPWKALSTFPEFASALGTSSAAVPPPPPTTLPPLAPGTLSSSSVVAPPNHGMAIAGLICSILGLFCCGPIFSTLGLVFSILALAQINENPLRYSGKGLALAGIILAVIGYGLFALFLFSGLFRRAWRRFPRHF